jgi:AAA family ATP:ADP antiporter
MIDSSQSKFGSWRTYLWPIHRNELAKFLPLLLMAFFITFNYNILRNMKDSLVITAASSGAEIIPFIKVWVLLPMAVVMTLFFTRLVNRFTRDKVFYIMIGTFLGFFVLFTFVLYPFRDYLHPHHFADYLQEHLPIGFKGFIAMFRYWTFTGFYVLAELWGSTVLFVLFWGFANEVTKVNEAKRFYGLIGIGANFSGVAAGQISIFLSPTVFNPNLPFGNDAWEQTLVLATSAIVLSGGIIMGIFRWLNNRALREELIEARRAPPRAEEAPKKMSMRENFAYLANSKYLICIALVVLCYNMVINLTEVMWKDQVKQLYSNPNDYYNYMGQISTIMGIIATLTALFISGNSLRKCGWTFTALIPPVILLVTSIGFFSFLIFKNQLTDALAMFGSTPLALAVLFGSAQNCLCRASKYTLFDATKELAFIPLDRDSKLKGKAAIDGVGSRLGKSGGAIMFQGLLMVFGTLSVLTPYIAIIVFAVIAVWIASVKGLGRRFTDLVAHNETLHLEKGEQRLKAEEPMPEEAEAAAAAEAKVLAATQSA